VKSLLPAVIEALVMPPGACVVLLLGALAALALGRRRAGLALAGAATALLWVAATPLVASALLARLEHQAAPVPATPARAIVILGGGSYFDAPEYGGHTVGTLTLERVRYGARLARESGLPVLVTGGDPLGSGGSEAAQMKAVLEREFGVAVTWAETASHTTRENATASAALLRAEGIGAVRLVTHAWHMPRARNAFEVAGLAVHPAPTVFTQPLPEQARALQWLPDAEALRGTRIALHEWLGRAWYRLQSVTP
jgi:uncharacterized SAM-binding protein YcdF (DUF218 family)